MDSLQYSLVRAATQIDQKLTYLSGSTFIFGIESLNFMSFLVMLRQFETASMRLRRLYDLILPESKEALDTKVTLVEGTSGYSLSVTLGVGLRSRRLTANIGRMYTGSIVGIEAFGSP
jgi:hypothetical protein